MLIAAYLIVFFGVFLLCFFLLISSSEKHSRFRPLNTLEEPEMSPLKSFYKKFSLKFSGLYEISVFKNMLEDLRVKLGKAGIIDRYTPEEYLSFSFIGFAAGFFLSLLCSIAFINLEDSSFGVFHGIVLVLIFSAVGWFMPALKISELIRARKKNIMKSLPFALDLITISIEAGMDLLGAIQRVVDNSEMNEFNYELYLFIHETKLGIRKIDSLKRMSDRIDIPVVAAIISSLIQAEELGMRVGQILRIQSQSLRTKQILASEKMAMEAPVKMMIPLALFIFPAVFIVLLGPLIIQFISK
ncbi:MAG: flp pilus assembly protein TadC [uncultured bacterium]|nr:MAG: flp pilus assembly protein TadC [uncultured bacterium]